MSTRDTDQDDDARFAAFLRKDDELSQLLRALDQPEPSAALDAAILRDAEIAL
ncbi:MAG: GntR family transcriptional regulator, partial [Proteobacteria bacterium]|nr:GntR family transcriptional regulator [Pseudomonadota bacterium]